MSFETQQIELSMRSSQTGLPLSANVYTIEGVTEADGSPRRMSIGQLVMAICLQRASVLEDQIIGVMDKINENTQALDGLTTVEAELVKVDVGGRIDIEQLITYNGQEVSLYYFLWNTMGLADVLPKPSTIRLDSGEDVVVWYYDQVQTVISLVEDKMDSLNTVSQDTLIQLQSLTAKRDQTYDLVSNTLKSLNNVLVGNANNM